MRVRRKEKRKKQQQQQTSSSELSSSTGVERFEGETARDLGMEDMVGGVLERGEFFRNKRLSIVYVIFVPFFFFFQDETETRKMRVSSRVLKQKKKKEEKEVWFLGFAFGGFCFVLFFEEREKRGKNLQGWCRRWCRQGWS